MIIAHYDYQSLSLWLSCIFEKIQTTAPLAKLVFMLMYKTPTFLRSETFAMRLLNPLSSFLINHDIGSNRGGLKMIRAITFYFSLLWTIHLIQFSSYRLCCFLSCCHNNNYTLLLPHCRCMCVSLTVGQTAAAAAATAISTPATL